MINNKMLRSFSIISIMLFSACSNFQAPDNTGATSANNTTPNLITTQATANTSAIYSSGHKSVTTALCEPISSEEQRWMIDSLFAKQTLPTDADLWQRILKGYSLPETTGIGSSNLKNEAALTGKPPINSETLIANTGTNNRALNNRIKKQVKWFTKHPDYLNRVSRRANKYLYFIVEHFEQEQIPMELALLPIVESGFDPFAYSPGSASGMWQFIGATGKRYGMPQDWWYDGRRDIHRSTQGAAAYLKDMNKRFNKDWLLTLAAYNAGEGNVARAIKRNKRAGKATDFWSLSLPRETRTYVPRLLAVAHILQNAQHYRQHFTRINNGPYFTSVNVGSQLDLAQAASLAGISSDELYRLNPGYKRWATPPNGPHQLLIPVDHIEQFSTALAALPKASRVNWQKHTVKSGESLSVIAQHYHTTIGAIRASNKLKDNRIRAKQSLLIPAATHSSQHYKLSDTQRLAQRSTINHRNKTKMRYKVKTGDNLWLIAKRYGVSVRQLAQWNRLARKDILRAGQRLTIWAAKT